MSYYYPNYRPYSSGDEEVRGYTKRDGTSVSGYTRARKGTATNWVEGYDGSGRKYNLNTRSGCIAILRGK